MDHWLGGVGRRAQEERLETCWALCLACNEKRGASAPSADHWNRLFARHCDRHGYRFVPHLTKFDLLAAAGRNHG